ncbi:MAG: hypothetical protein ACD_2C00096G0003 [uncultured bacterium (gcode 4)]|uniref:Acyltransferase 3 domain-containing protein n=1 Tax=uncultured bacterium (gcode 4) TaxID=1234023 RepID=K2G670_9BACT|nr:MAG: hypothetical protein ACD_2C00096G0003 [uncultured bacterium (gcode 4)]
MTNLYSPKRNFYISYIKWLSLIYMIIIHLVDWSDMRLWVTSSLLKEVLHTSLIFFVTLTWANIIQAYWNYENIKKPMKKLYKRIAILLAIYFAYNFIKFMIFDFSTSAFYLQFIEKGYFNIWWLLTFRSFTSPITVLIMDSTFLALSPILLYMNKNVKRKKEILIWVIIALLVINYWIVIPNYLPFSPANPYFPINQNPILDLLYANNYVLFPVALWAVPYLIWSLLAMYWFEKKMHEATLIFAIITIILGSLKLANNESLLLNPYIFPLQPYYIFVCFFALFVFVQIFMWMEKIKSRKIHGVLSVIRYLWDKSLYVYIYHWMVIDISIRIFFPYIRTMWLVMWVYLFLQLYLNRSTIAQYYEYWYKSWHYRAKKEVIEKFNLKLPEEA